MVSNLTVKVGADIAGLQKELQKATGHLNGFGKQMKVIGGAIGGVFAAGAIINFGKEVFNVTAQFQKFEAVLTNTLGNNSAAKAALAQITEFATKTPYAVNELTESFVKLANQGFVPTLDEMRSLGDLASAMGKSFDQLTEAIIDAQTGEFERLKEFGIRASKQGDQVTFTFKGVKKQVDFTADSIREYVLSLGQVEGVAGGMEAQSKTLGGGLSNLQDSFEQLQLAIGKSAESGGLFSKMLDMVAGSVKGLTELFRENTIQENLEAIKFFTEARRQAAMAGDMDSWKRANDAIQAATLKIREYKEGQDELKKAQDATTTSTQAQTASVRDLVAQWDNANSIFATKFNPADQIKSKTGGDFLFDSGAMTEMANASSRALEYLNQSLQVNGSAVKIWGEQVAARTSQAAEAFAMDLGPGISGVLTDFASALGRASAGMEDFGAAIMESIGGFMQQFGGALIALGIGEIALEKFGGPAMIAAGAVLAAAGAAVKASAQKTAKTVSSGSSSSVSSGGSSLRDRAGNIQDSNPQLVTVLKGEDMWIMLQNYSANNRLTHG